MTQERKVTCKECGMDVVCTEECELENTTNALRHLLNNMKDLTNEQLSAVSFESWNEAYDRSLGESRK